MLATPLDLLYVAYFAVVGPIIDYRFFWPAFQRRSQIDPGRARIWLCAWSIPGAWAGVAIGAALWLAQGRSWSSFGFSVPEGWRWWTSLAVCLLLVAYYAWTAVALARNVEARANARRQVGTLDAVVPHTQTELYWFSGMSLTAGFCEEFLFRGWFIWVCAPWLGWWGAAALSLAFFAGWHVYQGWGGVLKTGIVGACFTLIVALFGSLWPAIAVHALVDLGNGLIAWVVLREERTG